MTLAFCIPTTNAYAQSKEAKACYLKAWNQHKLGKNASPAFQACWRTHKTPEAAYQWCLLARKAEAPDTQTACQAAHNVRNKLRKEDQATLKSITKPSKSNPSVIVVVYDNSINISELNITNHYGPPAWKKTLGFAGWALAITGVLSFGYMAWQLDTQAKAADAARGLTEADRDRYNMLRTEYDNATLGAILGGTLGGVTLSTGGVLLLVSW